MVKPTEMEGHAFVVMAVIAVLVVVFGVLTVPFLGGVFLTVVFMAAVALVLFGLYGSLSYLWRAFKARRRS